MIQQSDSDLAGKCKFMYVQYYQQIITIQGTLSVLHVCWTYLHCFMQSRSLSVCNADAQDAGNNLKISCVTDDGCIDVGSL